MDLSVAARVFTPADQAVFSYLSGDTNPLHADPVCARRTQAGEWVVHGANALLWALDGLLRDASFERAPCSLKVRFERFIFLDERAVVRVSRRSDTALQAEIGVGGVRAVAITLGFGPKRAAQRTAACGPLCIAADSQPPLEHGVADLAGLAGSLAFARPASEVAALFPWAAAALGDARVAALAALSRLSGMVCPGLHSITSSYAVDFVEGHDDATGICFATERVAVRFRLATISVWGAGIEGAMDSFARRPPVAQRPFADIKQLVAPDAFAGSRVLVVGGSRGLGEATAKLVAAGGAATTLSYVVGREDAERVAADIRAGGGSSRVMLFDARLPIEPQLRDVAATHMYYFATPRIFRQQSGLFSPHVLAEFIRVYADGFFQTCRLLAARGPLEVFYPSTRLVEDPPRDAVEYVMAKAAGESLCAGIDKFVPGVHVEVRRLARVLTDQTASLKSLEGEDAAEVMLPLVNALQTVRSGMTERKAAFQ